MKVNESSNFSPETVYFSQMYDVKDIAELFYKNNKQNAWKSKSFYILALFKSCKLTRQNISKNELWDTDLKLVLVPDMITRHREVTLCFVMSCDPGACRTLTGGRQETQTRLWYRDWGSRKEGGECWQLFTRASRCSSDHSISDSHHTKPAQEAPDYGSRKLDTLSFSMRMFKCKNRR